MNIESNDQLKIDSFQEIVNYKKVLMFTREVLLVMRVGGISEAIFNFLREHLKCEKVGLIRITHGEVDLKLFIANSHLITIDEEIKKIIKKQIELDQTILHFVSSNRSISILLLKSRGELIGALLIYNSEAFIKTLELPSDYHLLMLFLSHTSSALRGAHEIDSAINQKLNQSITLDRDRLQSINKRLENAMQVKSEFLARMSHEMRTPLSVILGIIDSLEEKIQDRSVADLFGTMKNAGSSLLMLINDVLDISKIEANELKLDLKPLNFREFIEQTVALFREKAKQKSIQLGFRINQDVPEFVLGDTLRLKQVLFNLLGNALKFTTEGEIHLSVVKYRKRDHILFEISDTGIGLSAEQAKKIFEPFTQADESTTRKYGGTGLGLSITKKLVKLMGGEIFVTENKAAVSGSVFIFDCRLPATAAPAMSKQKTEISTEFLNRPLKILIAEDVAEIQLVMRLYLKNTRFQLSFAENGIEALEKYKAGSFDLVFMDIHMPILGGIDSTKNIREFEQQEKLAKTPIIALTANAETDNAEDMRLAGVDDVLIKPANKAQIMDCIVRWTEKKIF